MLALLTAGMHVLQLASETVTVDLTLALGLAELSCSSAMLWPVWVPLDAERISQINSEKMATELLLLKEKNHKRKLMQMSSCIGTQTESRDCCDQLVQTDVAIRADLPLITHFIPVSARTTASDVMSYCTNVSCAISCDHLATAPLELLIDRIHTSGAATELDANSIPLEVTTKSTLQACGEPVARCTEINSTHLQETEHFDICSDDDNEISGHGVASVARIPMR